MNRRKTAWTPHAGILLPVLGLAIACAAVPGCGGRVYDPARATRPYPEKLSQGETIQAEVSRHGTELLIVNATPQSFSDFDVWVNQRYMHHVDSLKAGESLRINITDFFDAWGETPIPGGFFRTEQPTPVILVQFQLDHTRPLKGLVTVPVNQEF